MGKDINQNNENNKDGNYEMKHLIQNSSNIKPENTDRNEGVSFSELFINNLLDQPIKKQTPASQAEQFEMEANKASPKPAKGLFQQLSEKITYNHTPTHQTEAATATVAKTLTPKQSSTKTQKNTKLPKEKEKPTGHKKLVKDDVLPSLDLLNESPIEFINKQFDIHKVKLGMTARIKIILAICLFLFIICVSIASTFQKITYSSEATLLYQEATKFVSNHEDSKFRIKQIPVENATHIITSPVNAQRTIDQLKLHTDAFTLNNKIKISIIEDKKKSSNKKEVSKIIRVKIQDMPTAQHATIVLNTYIEKALFNSDFKYRSEIKKTIDQYMMQKEKIESVLEKVNKELSKYPLTEKTEKTKSEYELYVKKIEYINDKISATELELSDMEAQLESYETFLNEMNSNVINDITAKNLLKKQIYELELELNKINSIYGPKHPQRRRLEREILELKKNIGQTNSRTLSKFNPLQAKYEEEALTLQLKKDITEQKLNAYKSRYEDLQEKYSKVSDRSAKIASLQSQKRSAYSILESLNQSIDDATLALSKNLSDFEIFDSATHATPMGEKSKKLKVMSIPFAVGFFLLFMGLIFETTDKYFRTSKELDMVFNDIPVVTTAEDYAEKDLFQKLFINLKHFLTFIENYNLKKKIFLFISTKPGEGKSTWISTFARYSAIRGKKVAVVNFHAPIAFKKHRSSFLTQDDFKAILEERLDVEQIAAPLDGVDLLQANFSEEEVMKLTQIVDLDKFFKILEKKYDMILVDSEPMNVSKSSLLLADFANYIFCIVGSSITVKDQVRDTINALETSDFNCTGFILNKVRPTYTSVHNKISIQDSIKNIIQKEGIIKRFVEKFSSQCTQVKNNVKNKFQK